MRLQGLHFAGSLRASKRVVHHRHFFLLNSGGTMNGQLVAAALCLSLAACSGLGMRGLSPGVSTERQVREAFGEPAMDLKEADGGRVLAYTTGPMGTQTWIARLGKDATLVSLEQVLDEQHMRQISPGTTTGEEVLRLIGPPWRKVDFPNKRQVAWDYTYADSWAYLVNYSVMVDQKGVVAETVNVRIEGGKNGRD
jgi:hypothetical protein